MGQKKKSPVKAVLKVILAIIILLALVVGGYLAYAQINYYRIDNETPNEVENQQADATGMSVGSVYTAVTYNIGFGAYSPDFSFFMDEGTMNDGTATVGEHSRGESKDVILANTQGAASLVANLDPDFALFQEVDHDSDRSYDVDQRAILSEALEGRETVYSANMHSIYLAYPVSEPIGTISSGLMTLSKSKVDSSMRYSYPIVESFPTKFFDLDRCFEATRISVDNGKELVLINSHMSAYSGDAIRDEQLEMLSTFMKEEYDKGNYVIAGGDWNQALGGSIDIYESQAQVPDWVAPFNYDMLPEGISVVEADNLADAPTCRGTDIAWEKGVTYAVTVDGYLVSDNVRATAMNVNADFAYSDHNPVILTFTLK